MLKKALHRYLFIILDQLKIISMRTTGIILAGGKSSRMGRNKALLELSGLKIIERIYKSIVHSCDDVIIISNSPDDYLFMELKIFKDIFPGLGPLAGIHSGLHNSKTENNLIISCDLPLISAEVITNIVKYESDKPVVIYQKKNRLQYLCGIYRKACLAFLETSLKSNNLRVKDFINKIDLEVLDAEEFPDEVFFNLNTIEDYETLVSRTK
jgi:molybdenum cofactor guanylyltransferase